MSLQEQYKKETGLGVFIDLNIDGVVNEVYSEQYVKWLENKLTWKKFKGEIDTFPALVKTIDGKLWTIKSKHGLDHAIQTCGEIYIDQYLPLTLPEEK